MPTKNPRLTITLQPAVSAQLAELSRLTGDSQSAIIADMLEKSAPVFDRVIKVLSAAEQAKAELKERMASDLEKAQTKIERQLGLALEGFDEYTGSLLSDVETVTRRRRASAGAEASAAPAGVRRKGATPPSNRGVRYMTSKAKVSKRAGGGHDPI